MLIISSKRCLVRWHISVQNLMVWVRTSDLYYFREVRLTFRGKRVNAAKSEEREATPKGWGWNEVKTNQSSPGHHILIFILSLCCTFFSAQSCISIYTHALQKNCVAREKKYEGMEISVQNCAADLNLWPAIYPNSNNCPLTILTECFYPFRRKHRRCWKCTLSTMCFNNIENL